MNRLAVLLAAAVLAAAAPAPKKASAPAKSSSTASVARGRIVSVEKGRLTLADDAGHLEQFQLDGKTRTTCDGKKTSWAKSAAPGACPRAVVHYDLHTKRVSALELRTAVKADADDAKGRPAVTGEVAVTDVLAGTLTVRLGGGSDLTFKVADATKILREAKGKAAQPIGLDAVKVGDRVEVHSKDWKTADEVHVSAAE